MEKVKQVIVIRKDLKMRKGKIAAQASHASLNALMPNMVLDDDGISLPSEIYHDHFDDVKLWLQGSHAKVVVYVNSEQELLDLYDDAIGKGLLASLIRDNGLTEFNGVKTYTAVAIGPVKNEYFTGLTDHLPLL